MQGSLKISLLLTVLFPLGLGALPVEPKQPTGALEKAPTAQACDYYKLGYEFGKKLIYTVNLSDSSPELMNQAFMDKEVLTLTTTISRENPTTDAHKKAFRDYQTYNKGLKEALATYTPFKETDMASQGKNYAIKMNYDIADISCKSPDMATLRTEMGNFMVQKAQDAQKIAPIRPKVNFTLDVNHPHYKEGYACGKQTCSWLILEAQGKPTPEDEQIALQKRMNNFMITTQQGKSQEEIINGSLQYLSGYKKSLEELNVEETLAKNKTPKEQAEKLRIGYKFALQGITSALDALQNPDKGFESMGKAFQDCATEMNHLQKS